MQKDLIKELGQQVKLGKMTWQESANEFTKQTGIVLSGNAMRKRFANLIDDDKPMNNEKINEEYETHYQNGTVELQKEVFFDPNEDKTPETILRKFGYNPDEWTLVEWRFGKWEVAIKDEKQNRVCTTIRAKLKPKQKEMSTTDYLQVAKEVFSEEIKPLSIKAKPLNKTLDENKLLEVPAIELHLGKLCWAGDTKENYDYKIASERFRHIIEEVVNEQEVQKASTCFISIGSDFFNSDTVNDTTTKGTQQNNDIRWKKLFLQGLKLYAEALLVLRDKFNKIDVQLVQGNHDVMASFYLYIALKQHFLNDKTINFSDNLHTTQCYTFGKCAIFTNHGDPNLKRLIKSIPAEFYEEWGKALYRELHIGHFHKEVVVDDESGLITRRIGSPSATDEWHYNSRFVGATQKHQLFVWDKEQGLLNCRYITFEQKKNDKVKVKK